MSRLEPDSVFEVTILGSGSCVPTLKRGSPGLVLRICDDLVLMDGGTGTLRSLLGAGLDYRDLTHLLYSHIHPDHTADLIPLLLATRYTPDFTRTCDLAIWGPSGFRDFFDRLTAVYPFSLEGETYRVDVAEVGRTLHRQEGWEFRAQLLRHTVPDVGYRVEVPALDRTLVYTGDTEACPELAALARNADLLISECSFPDDGRMEGHLTPTQIGRIAEEAGVKHLLLTHLYPVCDREDILSSVRKVYSGRVEKAEDLMRVSLA